ncbi:hypothetical protein [Thermoclostridium stercorarium]
MLEEFEKEIEIEKKTVRLFFRPFEIKTLRLRIKS